MSKETMSDETQREILDVLEKLMYAHPDWRIGQLVANVAFLARQTDNATWDVENQEFLQASRQHLQKMEERSKVQAQAKQEIAARQKVAA